MNAEPTRTRVPAGVSAGGQFAAEPRAEAEVKLPDYSWDTDSPTWNELQAMAGDPDVSDDDYHAALEAKVAASEAKNAGTWSVDDATPEQVKVVDEYREMVYAWANANVEQALLGFDDPKVATDLAAYAVRRIVSADFDLREVPGAQDLYEDFDRRRAVERAHSLCSGPRQQAWAEKMARHPGLGMSSFGSGTFAMRARADAVSFVDRLRREGVRVAEEANGPRGGRYWRITATTDPATDPNVGRPGERQAAAPN